MNKGLIVPFITDTGFSEMLLPPGRSGGFSWLACLVRQLAIGWVGCRVANSSAVWLSEVVGGSRRTIVAHAPSKTQGLWPRSFLGSMAQGVGGSEVGSQAEVGAAGRRAVC